VKTLKEKIKEEGVRLKEIRTRIREIMKNRRKTEEKLKKCKYVNSQRYPTGYQEWRVERWKNTEQNTYIRMEC
jgi:hypothetical protein